MAQFEQQFYARLLAIAISAIALCARAQSSDRSIIFSTPVTDGVQAVIPSLSSQDSRVPVLPNSLLAPDPALNFNAVNSRRLAPSAGPSAPQQQRMKKLLEERKNWTMMTPAEIFGVTPTEDMLKPAELDATGHEKIPTQLERYLAREKPQANSSTNVSGLQDGRDVSAWNTSRDRNGFNPTDPDNESTANAAQRLAQFLNGRPNSGDVPSQRQKSYGWDAISPPVKQISTKPDLEQLAAMQRFRELLTPSGPSSSDAQDGSFFSVPKAAPKPDPNITQPDYVPNPSGASYTPLASSIGKPSGIAPLPGITSPLTTPTVVPAWRPQPAPWLSQGPRAYVMPQRKF